MKKKFSQLQSSMEKEEKKIEDKFAKADNIFLKNQIHPPHTIQEKKPKITMSISINQDELDSIDDIRFEFAKIKKNINRSEIIRCALAFIKNKKTEDINDIYTEIKNK